MSWSNEKLMQERFANDRREVEAVRARAQNEYRYETGQQYTPMLGDVRFLLGQLNVKTQLWESAEKELDDIRECDKCDLCEDHHE